VRCKHGGYDQKVGVIGAGQMGNGIAMSARWPGFDVVLNDVSADRMKGPGDHQRQSVAPGRQEGITEDATASRRWRASLPPRPWTSSAIAIW
jgi:3-hydroxyacyl-CoA dehydrogenase